MIDHVRGGESRQPVAHPSWSGAITGAAIAAALVAGFLAAVAELVAVAVAAGVGLFGLVAWRPVLATYLYPGTLPFIGGIERGTWSRCCDPTRRYWFSSWPARWREAMSGL